MPGKNYYFWRDAKKRDAGWLKPVLYIIFALLLLRVAHLQLLKGSDYFRMTEANRLQYFRVPAPRGRVYDRNGEKLAGGYPSYSLFISPEGLEAHEKKDIAEKVEKFTGRSADRILARFHSSERQPFGVVVLATHLSKEEILKIEENFHHIPRAFIHSDPSRYYPYGEDFSHLIGYTGQISNEELSRLRRHGYRMRDRIGKAGIERVYDRVVRGLDGYQEVEVGVTGHHRKILNVIEPQPGNDLLLTIDRDLQLAAARALGDRAGSVVAMNPKTGEILIWLSKPGYDPDAFTAPLTRRQVEEIFQNPLHPLFNRPIQGQYPPGSLFKLVTAAAALEEGVGPGTRYNCQGHIVVGQDKRVFRCWRDSRHGNIDMAEALSDSCNIYFYYLGMDVGSRVMRSMAEKMGFASRSQGIFPGERTGVIPDPDWKRSNVGGGWNPGDSANMSVGQGFVLATPMQLLKMTSMIAADGTRMKPYAVRMVVDRNGNLKQQFLPEQERPLNVSEQTLGVLKNGMEMAVTDGTASFFNVPVSAAAKTGTAQNPFGEDHAWFAAYAPAEDPEIAIVVMVEHGGYGSVAAMPVARAVFREKFGSRVHAKAD